MFKTGVIALALSILATPAFACDEHGKSGFLPENDMYIGVNDKNVNNMTEELFNAIIDRADEHYAPIVKSKGGTLKFNRKWDNGTVNASASQWFGTWNVNMYGGLARHEKVTADGFALVVCHELGHHLGGAPKKGTSWASNEGQSDYWGNLKCFRRIFESDDNAAIVAQMEVPETVTKRCNENFSLDADIALCVRASMAGKSLAELLGTLRGTPNVDFDTPDTNVVSTTNDAHPAAQCRMDTYFQGALCDRRISDEVSTDDALAGTCNRIDGYENGNRPLCWYKPESM